MTLTEPFIDTSFVSISVVMPPLFDRRMQFNSTNCVGENINTKANFIIWVLGDETGSTTVTYNNYTASNYSSDINGDVSIFWASVYMDGFHIQKSSGQLTRLIEIAQ